jgi:hypothetical protein
MTSLSLADVHGAELHEGSVVVDVKGAPHVIHHFAEYPGRFIGDHARVAYYTDGSEATVADHQRYHVHRVNESSVMVHPSS